MDGVVGGEGPRFTEGLHVSGGTRRPCMRGLGTALKGRLAPDITHVVGWVVRDVGVPQGDVCGLWGLLASLG